VNTTATPVKDATTPIAQAGEPVSLDASCSDSPNGTIISWDWDFDDTNTGSGQMVQHTYAAAGFYTVTLTIEDDQGNMASTQQEVVVPESILDFLDQFDGGQTNPGDVPDWTHGFTGDRISDPWNINDQGELHILTETIQNGNECNIWAGDPGIAGGDITINFDVECNSGGRDGAEGVNFGVFFYAEAPGLRDDGGTGIHNVAIEWIDGPVDQRPGSSGLQGLFYNPGRSIADHLTGTGDGEPPREWWVTVEEIVAIGVTRVRMWGDGVLYLDFGAPHSQVAPTGYVGMWAGAFDVEVCIDNFQVRSGIELPTNCVDMLPPILEDDRGDPFFPPDITGVEPSDANGETVDYSAFITNAVDDCDDDVLVECVPASGSLFPPDSTTMVTCTLTDDSGKTTEYTFNVSVNPHPGGLIQPGDSNASGGPINIADAQRVLNILFTNANEATPCDGAFNVGSNLDIMDWNTDGNVNIADPSAMLNNLFISGSAPGHNLGTDCIRRVGCPDVCTPAGP